MHFFNPTNLIWLIPASGSIVLMYILKLRRRDVVVSSTFLWRQVIRDVQANAPFQKLRKNLLLFLQLLAVAFLVFALSRPFWRGKGIGGRSVVIVVDTSASMGAREGNETRLDQARQQAGVVVDSMRPEDQMILLTAAARPAAITGFTGDKGELARAIGSLKTRDTGTNMRDAVNLAAALVATREASQIDVISDGAFGPITNVNLAKTHVVFHQVGKSRHNIGIAAVDFRHGLSGEKKVEVFVTVHNFDTVPQTCNAELYLERPGTKQPPELLDAHEVKLPPDGESPDIFDLPEPSEAVTLRVKIDAKDDLAADNEASLVITPRKLVKALLVTDENVFLQTGILVDPNVELNVAKPGGFTKPDGYDAVVFDGAAPKTLPDGNYLFVNCSSNQSPATPGAEIENQGLVDTNRNHPVMRYVDFGNVRWTSMRSGKPAGWAQELASSESGAAIVAGEKGQTRALWTGFNLDLAHGKFPFTVGFPIFISNALRWLSHNDESATQTRTGIPLTIDAPATAGRLTVLKPDGSQRSLALPSRGPAVFDDTDEIGVYTVTGDGGFQRQFAANLADYAESDITPHRNPEIGGTMTGQVGRQVTVTREIWPWLAVLLLGLLAFEWYAFHRRVYVS